MAATVVAIVCSHNEYSRQILVKVEAIDIRFACNGRVIAGGKNAAKRRKRPQKDPP
jgi:hypothetical protein